MRVVLVDTGVGSESGEGLRELMMSYNAISDVEAEELARVMRRAPALVHLRLDSCHLSDRSVVLLASAAFESNRASLRELDLSRNL